jgi:hypothetical protein
LADQILQQQAVSGLGKEQEYLQPKQLFARQQKILLTGPTPRGSFVLTFGSDWEKLATFNQVL